MSLEFDSTPPAEAASAIARTIAVAMRNITVYPESHPRSQNSAADSLALVRSHGGASLQLQDHDLSCNGTQLQPDPQVNWIVERLRAATLRGIEILPECTVEDLLQFARVLIGAGREGLHGETARWPTDHARLRTMPLVIAGTFGGRGSFGDRGGGGLGSDDDGDDGSSAGVGPRYGEIQLGTAIGRVTQPGVDGGVHAETGKAIGELMAGAFKQDTGDRLNPLARAAARIATTYFGNSEDKDKPAEDEMPSGRPGDAGIDGDIDSLIEEIAQLPEAASPVVVREETLSYQAHALAQQLLGVYLYLFLTDCSQTARADLATPLRRTIAVLGADAGLLLDAYLARDQATRVSIRDRIALLQLIDQANQHRVIVARGYLDEDLLVAGPAEILPVALRAMDNSPQLADMVYRAMRTLSGGEEEHAAFEEAAMPEALLSTRGVRAILTAGGPWVKKLIRKVTGEGRLDLFAAILEYFRDQQPEPAERLALATLQARSLDCASYLESLYDDLAAGAVSKEVRSRSSELLHLQLREERSEGNVERQLQAIEALAAVPDVTTVEVLTNLARRPRWHSWRDRGGIRAKARQILAEVKEDLKR